MARSKLKKPKTRHNFALANIDQLRELRDRLTPTGLEMTDSQALDIVVATLHGAIIEKGLEVVDLDGLLAIVNEHFKRAFSQFLAEVLSKAGHKHVRTQWREDGSVQVWWDEGGATIPAKVFAGERMDKDGLLREMRTGLPV